MTNKKIQFVCGVHAPIVEKDYPTTDLGIIAEVENAFAEADRLGENWVDHLPDYIWFDDSADGWDRGDYVGSLADNRQVFWTCGKVVIL